jgi:hypothetical protein
MSPTARFYVVGLVVEAVIFVTLVTYLICAR